MGKEDKLQKIELTVYDWLLRLHRSKSLYARSWLLAGCPVAQEEAAPVFDVVTQKPGASTTRDRKSSRPRASWACMPAMKG